MYKYSVYIFYVFPTRCGFLPIHIPATLQGSHAFPGHQCCAFKSTCMSLLRVYIYYISGTAKARSTSNLTVPPLYTSLGLKKILWTHRPGKLSCVLHCTAVHVHRIVRPATVMHAYVCTVLLATWELSTYMHGSRVQRVGTYLSLFFRWAEKNRHLNIELKARHSLSRRIWTFVPIWLSRLCPCSFHVSSIVSSIPLPLVTAPETWPQNCWSNYWKPA